MASRIPTGVEGFIPKDTYKERERERERERGRERESEREREKRREGGSTSSREFRTNHIRGPRIV